MLRPSGSASATASDPVIVSAPFTDRTPDWLTVERAIARVLGGADPLSPLHLSPTSAAGLVLAEDVVATATLPPHDNSAMDGYAVRASDLPGASVETPVSLRVVGHATPGPPIDREVRSGEAIRITTGAPVPPGADSIVRVEDTDREAVDGTVEIHSERDTGRNVRPAGRDLRPGDVVARAGQLLTPGVLGVTVAAATELVVVHPRPHVTILTTGDELAGPDRLDEVRRGDAIADLNGPMLAAAVQAAGGIPRLQPAAPDDLEVLGERLDQARDTDLLITVGGASMGTGDLVKRALDRLGFELDFWRVNMRPGSPFGFGLLPREGGTPLAVCSLPGNPASAFVTFELFARPLIRKLAGRADLHRPTVVALASETLPGNPRLTMFPRVRLETDEAGFPSVRRAGDQSSGLVHSLAQANALAVVPPSDHPVEAGTPLRVLVLDDTGGGAPHPAWLEPVDVDGSTP